jgi:hypothetical protein
MKQAAGLAVLLNMEEQKRPRSASQSSQPDKNLAADARPVPSQAEGDLETVEEDLKQKDRRNQGTSKSARSGH